MPQSPDSPEEGAARSARWPALVAALSLGLLSAALPEELQVGPRWTLAAVAASLLAPSALALRRGDHRRTEALGFVLSALMTLALCVSLGLLLDSLPQNRASAVQLIRSAGVLWLSNVLVFALWYWRLDAGGPHVRDARPGHPDGAFLFPQMTLDGHESWSPEFVDYLFLAFTTSTAFSPTDAPPLSRWAKALMMVQSLVSLLILSVVAARAINVL